MITQRTNLDHIAQAVSNTLNVAQERMRSNDHDKTTWYAKALFTGLALDDHPNYAVAFYLGRSQHSLYNYRDKHYEFMKSDEYQQLYQKAQQKL